MKALSVKQPWAWLICAGIKDIENRDWRIGRKPRYGPYKSHKAGFTISLPERIYIHASKDEKQCLITAGELYANLIPFPIIERLPRGAIIGEVDIVDCVTKSDSPWFVGKYGFVLKNPALYEKPIPYKGQLGFFEVDMGMGY